jgi:Zn-dependent protease
MSVVVHEVSHGLTAFYLGDSTAKYAGRLTLNPVKHLDLWGSFVVPFLMIISFGFGFGWAKPVPYNPYNLKDQRKGPAWVALSGPLSNIILAIAFGIGARFIPLSYTVKMEITRGIFDFANLSTLLSGSFPAIFFWIFMMILTINIFLAVFNLIPIPPLDGSKILPKFLPFSLAMQYEKFRRIFEQNVALGFGLVILLFVLFLAQPLYAFTIWIASNLIGF